jgi:hypothetical protein
MDKKALKILVCTQYDPTIMERIRKRFPGVTVNVVKEDGQLLMALPESDVLYLQKEIPLKISEKMGPLIAASKRLKWIQWGYNRARSPEAIRIPLEAVVDYQLKRDYGRDDSRLCDFSNSVVTSPISEGYEESNEQSLGKMAFR